MNHRNWIILSLCALVLGIASGPALAAFQAGAASYLPLVIRQDQVGPAPEPSATPSPTATEPPVATAEPTANPSPGCDPSYPTVCIPPPPPDLDCMDIPYNNFQVLPPDPHNFDRDQDGVGCEA